MPACAYGGRVKSTVQQDVIYATAADLFGAVSWAETWFGPIMDMVLPRLVTLTDMCLVPPRDPVIPDLYNLALSGELYKLPNVVVDWLFDSWKAQNWNDFCECNPSNLCPSFNATLYKFFKLNAPLDSEVLEVYTRPPNDPPQWRRIYRNWSNTLGNKMSVTTTYRNSAGVSVGTVVDQLTTEAKPVTRVTGIPATTHTIEVQINKVAFVGHALSEEQAQEIEATFEWAGCSAVTAPTVYVPPPEDPQPPLLPPIPAGPTGCTTDQICSQIYQLSNAVQILSRDVTLIQRQAVPFSYVAGASHAVSGTGQFAVQGILGLSVNVTAGGSLIGASPGTPEAKFQYGWISFGTADGWIRRTPIRHDPTLMLDVNGAVTKIGYTLATGVSATITELVREP